MQKREQIKETAYINRLSEATIIYELLVAIPLSILFGPGVAVLLSGVDGEGSYMWLGSLLTFIALTGLWVMQLLSVLGFIDCARRKI